MAVDTKHDDYIKQEPEWQKCLDFDASEAVVVSRGVTYCPKPAGQTDEEYEAYMKRASLSMYFKKTIETYRGMATRVPTHVTDPEQVEEYLENITGSGQGLTQYVYNLLKSFFRTGRAGTLLSLPVGATHADPMFLFYNEMSITNWREVVVDSKTVLKEVRLREVVETSIAEFESEESYQTRVLDLDDAGFYRVRVYDDGNGQVGEDVYPLVNNKKITYIPFVFHGGVAVKPPFLIEIADLNKHHFRLTCEYYNDMYRTSQKQYWLSGVDKKEVPTHIGGDTIWAFSDSEATAGLLEAQNGESSDYRLSRQDIKDTISSLAVNLVLNTDGNSTATQANIDSSNQTASLAGIINQLSGDMTQLMSWACEWMNKACGEVKISTDFVSKQMTPEMINAIRQSWLDGAISYDTMWTNLQQGEISDQHKTAEQEQSDIENNEPPGMTGVAEAGTGNVGSDE